MIKKGNTVRINCSIDDKSNCTLSYVKICQILYVILNNTGGYIQRHLGLLAEMAVLHFDCYVACDKTQVYRLTNLMC